MQCNSYIPVYYHARDIKAGATVFSWHPFDTNSGEEIGCDTEVLKQMIQNHEATFRYQVQELHRLYTRQKELMDEMRVKEILAQHLQSRTSESVHSLYQARPETPSRATSWLLGDLPHNTQIPPNFVPRNYQEGATTQPDSLIRKNSYHDVKFLSSSSRGNADRILDLQLPAGVHQGKQFKEGNHSEAPNRVPNFEPSDSHTDSVKISNPADLHLNSWKKDCFFDLNEPVQLESPPSSPSDPSDSSHMEIDLNSIPASCFSETEISQETHQSVNRESCTYNAAMKNEELVEDNSFVDNKINVKLMKNGFQIDLNTGIEDEHCPSLSNTIVEIKLEAEGTELMGPLSPENEECSPPRGKSEVETPLLSEQGEGEPSLELDDTSAAQTLVTISSLRIQEYYTKKSLCWFAEIVSSIAENDFEASRLKSKENVEKERSFGKGRTKGRKQHKEEVASSIIKGQFKRKTGRKVCAKPRKYSMSSILKQPAVVHLQSWGRMRKRQGGRRRRPTKSLVSFS